MTRLTKIIPIETARLPVVLTQEDRRAILAGGAIIGSEEGRRLLRIFMDRAHHFAPLKMYHPEAEQLRIAIDMVEAATRDYAAKGLPFPWEREGWRERLAASRGR